MEYDRIELDFPFSPRSRFGYEGPRHPELDAIVGSGRQRYVRSLERWLGAYSDELASFAIRDPADPSDPTWMNDYVGGPDCVSLYGLLRDAPPARFVEVGSGESTRWARRAVRDAGASTRIVSIDPDPRADVDQLCDEVVRSRLEDADLSIFGELTDGDVAFIDGSHRVFMNSDATVFMLEVLPRLAPGVLVHIHDIFLPEDYPPDWADRHYSEQYLLAAWLLGGSEGLEIVFPSWYVNHDPEILGMLLPLWRRIGMTEAEYMRGCSMWLRTVRRDGKRRLGWRR